MAAISVGGFDRRVGGTRRVALGVLRGREGDGREGVMGDRRGRGRLTIGVVVQLNDAAGRVEVGDTALIGAVERSRALFDNEFLL